MQMQVVPKANTWIKSNQSITLRSGKVIEKPLLNLVRKMMSQSLRVRINIPLLDAIKQEEAKACNGDHKLKELPSRSIESIPSSVQPPNLI
ncbi:hypothetical protein D5086_001786 [Populus alba]|uniref:Uncharacterized protein n=1 Tax=Populus alba TaxID=43335 RepID=A0ACC4CZS2_POPAL